MFQASPGNFIRQFGLALALLVIPANQARSAESYFMAVFGAQNRPRNKAALAHSFAVFVKATGSGESPRQYRLEHFMISWLPETLDVKLYRLRAETGYNLTLAESLQWAADRNLGVSMYGPYQIEPCLYEAAWDRKTQLESGAVRYKAIDSFYPAKRVSNCIHAVSDIGMNTARLRLGSPSWGDPASYFITLSLRPWIVDPYTHHDWLLAPLALANLPLIRHSLDEGNPNPRPVQRMMQNLAHWHLLQHVKK